MSSTHEMCVSTSADRRRDGVRVGFGGQQSSIRRRGSERRALVTGTRGRLARQRAQPGGTRPRAARVGDASGSAAGSARARRRANARISRERRAARVRRPARITGCSSGRPASDSSASPIVSRDDAVLRRRARGTPACGPATSPCRRSACAAAGPRTPAACRRSRGTARPRRTSRLRADAEAVDRRAGADQRRDRGTRRGCRSRRCCVARQPPSSRIARTSRDSAARSPLSRRTAVDCEALPAAAQRPLRAPRAPCRRCRSAA